MNTVLILSYDGSSFHGWQRQKNAPSVQETLENALAAISPSHTPPTLHGCGRTDSGVHAAVYAANARLETTVPLDKLPLAVNSHLPASVSVHSALTVPDDFHARFSCRLKRYTYTVQTGRTPEPLMRKYASHFPKSLNVSEMERAASYFTGTHDFAAVRSLGTDVKSTVRTVTECLVEQSGDYIRISVTANGFLYNMARTIAGTLLCAGCGMISADDIPNILISGDRDLAGPTAPAHGLCLTGLWYDGFELSAYAPCPWKEA